MKKIQADAWQRSTEEERIALEWQLGTLGDFRMSLMSAIARADKNNLKRLALGFPAEVAAYKLWTTTDFSSRLRAEGIDV